jgi:phage-related protein
MSEKREIKTTLAIDGEKQFKAAMNEAYRGMKVLGSEMKLNTAIFGDNASSMEGLTKKGEILGKQISQQKEIVAALSKAVEDSAAAYGESDKRTDAYRIKLNNATAALNKMEGELEGNEQAIKDFGKETADADTKTSKWNATLKKVTETLGKGVVVAAKATAAAVGAVAVAAGAAAVKLGKEVVKEFGELEQNLGGAEAVFGEYADAIKKHGEEAYKSLGASQSDYLATANKMGALFQGSGLSQQKSLELTTQAMQRAADMASVMGIDTQVALDSVAGAAKGNFTMMDNLGVAMNATTLEAYALSKGLKFTWNTASNADKAELAMQMFFEKTQQYAGNFAKEAEGTITGSIGMMKAATSSFIAGLGNSNADMTALTQNMVNALNAVITNITPVLQNIVTALPAVVDTIVQNIGTMLPMLLDTATNMFAQVLNMLVSMLPQLTPVAVDALLTITRAIIDNLPMIIQSANSLVMSLISGIQESIPIIMPAAVEGISLFVQGIISAMPKVLKAGVSILVELIKGITKTIPQIIPAAIDGVMTMVEAIIDSLPEILEAGIEMIMALIDGLIKSIPRIIEAMPKIINSFIDYIVKALPMIIEAGIKITIALIGGLIKAIPDIIAAMPQIIGGIVSGLMAGLGEIANVGVNLVKGLWEGIKSTTQWLWDKLTGWIDDALGWIGDLLGIHSPSRVMADKIGKPMVQGVAVGILKNAGLVNDAMESIVPDTSGMLGALGNFDRISGPVSVTGKSSLTVSLDESALDRLAAKLADVVNLDGAAVVLNDREMGRWVRKVALA